MDKSTENGRQWSWEFFPTNQDPADILGRTNSDSGYLQLFYVVGFPAREILRVSWCALARPVLHQTFAEMDVVHINRTLPQEEM